MPNYMRPTISSALKKSGLGCEEVLKAALGRDKPLAPALRGIEGRGRRAERDLLDYIRRRKSDRGDGKA